jgi:hypothetical protein
MVSPRIMHNPAFELLVALERSASAHNSHIPPKSTPTNHILLIVMLFLLFHSVAR